MSKVIVELSMSLDGFIARPDGRIAQQCLKLGLLDEIQLHLVPVLLGAGIRLFDHLGSGPIQLAQLRVVETARVTHFGIAL